MGFCDPAPGAAKALLVYFTFKVWHLLVLPPIRPPDAPPSAMFACAAERGATFAAL